MEILHIEDAIKKVGGRFRLTVLINKRIRELIRGYQPLVKTNSKNLMEIALKEILEGKIEIAKEEQPPDTPLEAPAAPSKGEEKKKKKKGTKS